MITEESLFHSPQHLMEVVWGRYFWKRCSSSTLLTPYLDIISAVSLSPGSSPSTSTVMLTLRRGKRGAFQTIHSSSKVNEVCTLMACTDLCSWGGTFLGVRYQFPLFFVWGSSSTERLYNSPEVTRLSQAVQSRAKSQLSSPPQYRIPTTPI